MGKIIFCFLCLLDDMVEGWVAALSGGVEFLAVGGGVGS